jgi:hypothetical protein
VVKRLWSRQINNDSAIKADMLIIIISNRIYNQLVRIEQLPGKNAVYAGTSALPKKR